MSINKMQNGTTLTIEYEGRLDTTTAPELETEVKASIEGIKELIFDFKNLEYISSAGLRVLLSCQKIMYLLNGLFGANGLAAALVVGETCGAVFAYYLLSRWKKKHLV